MNENCSPLNIIFVILIFFYYCLKKFSANHHWKAVLITKKSSPKGKRAISSEMRIKMSHTELCVLGVCDVPCTWKQSIGGGGGGKMKFEDLFICLKKKTQ